MSAYIASVPVQAKCSVSCVSRDSGSAKIGAIAKKEKGLEGAASEDLQANPMILMINLFAHERGF